MHKEDAAALIARLLDFAAASPSEQRARRTGLAGAEIEQAFSSGGPVLDSQGPLTQNAQADDVDDDLTEEDTADPVVTRRSSLTRRFGIANLGSETSLPVILHALKELKHCLTVLERNVPVLRRQILESITTRDEALCSAASLDRAAFQRLPLSHAQMQSLANEYRIVLKRFGVSTPHDLDNLDSAM